jgi:HEAT repeat protein
MPDLKKFRKPSAYYYELHVEAMEQHDFEKRVAAQWGLIARGKESIPYLQRMLARTVPDSREDAAGAFEWLASTGGAIVDDLLRALVAEVDDQPRDSIVLALGSLGDRRAIPALADLIRDERTDGDTR